MTYPLVDPQRLNPTYDLEDEENVEVLEEELRTIQKELARWYEELRRKRQFTLMLVVFSLYAVAGIVAGVWYFAFRHTPDGLASLQPDTLAWSLVGVVFVGYLAVQGYRYYLGLRRISSDIEKSDPDVVRMTLYGR